MSNKQAKNNKIDIFENKPVLQAIADIMNVVVSYIIYERVIRKKKFAFS